jgi:tRNA(fMet)-specific endonuclease VapC
MTYLLDSNACIVYLKRPASGIREHMLSIGDSEIRVCSIVKSELFYGARKSNNPTRALEIQYQFFSRFICLPFDDKAAEVYGIIRARLEAMGRPIGPYDLQIASIAIANNLILVTRNVSEFSRLAELRWQDWED